MGTVLGDTRRSQLITTYGIGAIIAIEDESFMIAGLDLWDGLDQSLWIHEPRLERRFNVRHFVLPPASGDEERDDIPVVRFPRWYSCSGCNELNEHRRLTAAFDENVCSTCGASLIPSRFVMACDAGHIDDFPYLNWVHEGPPDDGDHSLTISTLGMTASLRDIVIECSCGDKRSMENAFQRDALDGIQRCTAQQRWLVRKDPNGCTRTPRVLQRGASNVWFPVTESAISIPPWSDGAFKLLNRNWEILRHIPEAALPGVLEGLLVELGPDLTVGYSASDLLDAVRERRALEASSDDGADTGSIKDKEHDALKRGRHQESARQDFVCVPAEDVQPAVRELFDAVMVVKRLREVRVLSSFTRLREPEASDLSERVSPLAKEPVGWLPAVEVVGEGIFLSLAPDRLSEWERQEGVVRRSELLRSNAQRRERGKLPSLSRRISPRLLLVHTLAHVLINQWSLDCGYPAASLRERLYVTGDQTALLIYTATSDSAGSLGGLISQARPDRLEYSLRSAISSATWCSSDPLCVESDPSGTDALNLAACHSCTLLPETSCEEMNLLLDRVTLVGGAAGPAGYFRHWVD